MDKDLEEERKETHGVNRRTYILQGRSGTEG